MPRHHTTQLAIVFLACTVGIMAACNKRDEAQPPVAQTQSNSRPQAANSPESVTGCLRAGDAPGTFVLTTSLAADGRETTTYQLAGSAGVNLADHVGHRIAVQGIVRSQQESTIATSAAATADKAKGTSGTPTVATTATVDLKHMDVTSVTRAAGKCETNDR
jgi:hypothetical protein